MPQSYVSPRFSAIDSNGRPLVGGRLYTYANTTTTPQVTYKDADGLAANTNPIILDARGEAVVFLEEGMTYTWVLKTADDALVWSQDDISGATASTGGITVVNDIPPQDIGGPVYLPGRGIFYWNGSAYVSDFSKGFGGGPYAIKNKVTNGDFRLWPHGQSVGPIVVGSGSTRFAAGWAALITGTASVTMSKTANIANFGQGQIQAFSAKATSNASVTPGASDKNLISHAMLGRDLLGLGLGSLWGGKITLSFWAQASAAGDYSVALRNSGTPGFRSYVAKFSVQNPDTPEFKRITIPVDQSGIANWPQGPTLGATLIFDLGSGSSFEGAVDTWLSTETTRVAGTVRIVSSNAAYLSITGVQLEYGSAATPFEDRPVAIETALLRHGILPARYRAGCLLTHTTTTVTVSTGQLRDAADSMDLFLGAALTKTIQTTGAWAAGDNQNGLFSGAKANSTWYDVFVIQNDETGALDVGFDTTVTADNRPAGWTSYQILGSVYVDGSGNIQPFVNPAPREFYWVQRVQDVNSGPASNAAAGTAVTLSVPIRRRVFANIGIWLEASSTQASIAISPSDAVPSAVGTGGALGDVFRGASPTTQFNTFDVLTSNTAQVIAKAGPVAISSGLNLSTRGWREIF